MTYKWKLPGLIPVDAQVAGEELDRIYKKHGSIQPRTVVEESAATNAPLHGCFEWDNEVAAGLYRENQARTIIQHITVCLDERQEKPTRAFVSVKKEYEPIYVVINSQDKMDELLRNAIQELKAFQAKYSQLSELQSIFSEIQKLAG